MFWGLMTVTLSLRKAPSKQLFLDFRGLSIGNYKVNGEPVSEVNVFRDHKIYIPTQLLSVGEDKVNIVRLL